MGEKSFDESVAEGFSYPVLTLDNDIPPAVTSSSRAEDASADKDSLSLIGNVIRDPSLW